MSNELKETLESGLDLIKSRVDSRHDEYSAKFAEINAVITDLAQKGSAPVIATQGRRKLFDLQSKAADLASLANGDSRRINMWAEGVDVRTAIKAVVGDAGGVGFDPYYVQPQLNPALYNDPRRPLSLLEALPRRLVTSNAYEFNRLDGYVNAAAYQLTEGAPKAEGDLPTDLVSAPILTIAHYLKMSKQVMADVPALEMVVSNLMRYGTLQKAELEIMKGATVGGIQGLETQATAFTPSVGATAADAIGEAITALRVAGWVPDTVVLHPSDWFAIQSERSTGDGQYVAAAGWTGPATPSVWGVRAVASAAKTAGTALVLDSSQVEILDREAPRMELGYTGEDFTSNLIVALVEMRLGLAVYSPSAVLELTI